MSGYPWLQTPEVLAGDDTFRSGYYRTPNRTKAEQARIDRSHELQRRRNSGKATAAELAELELYR